MNALAAAVICMLAAFAFAFGVDRAGGRRWAVVLSALGVLTVFVLVGFYLL